MTQSPQELTNRLGLVDRSSTTADVLADLLDTLRLATITYGRFELGAPWGIQLPDDDVAHIVVVGRGTAYLQPEGIHRPVVLSTGDLALLPHGGAHTLRDAAGSVPQVLGPAECQRIRTARPVRLGGDGARTTLVMAAFRFRMAHRTLSLQRLSRCIHIAADEPAASRWLASTVQMLIAESSSSDPGAAIVINRLADVLLVQAIRTFIATSDCGKHGLRALADPQIGSALALIHEQPGAPWTVETLAAAVTLSRSGFAARFSALVGAAPLEYLTRWRMTVAAKLLRESDLTMIDVARQVGYQSEASFNRAFKRCEGMAPGTYRRTWGVNGSPPNMSLIDADGISRRRYPTTTNGHHE
jgi:AraC-like DNA-binding protein